MNLGRWFWIGFYIILMTVFAFLAFDDIALVLVFGIGVGGIFGWAVTTKKR